jgi:hypothetical protein
MFNYDFVAKKYKLKLGDEELNIFIKNGKIVNADFMNQQTAISLDLQTIKEIKSLSNSDRTLNANQIQSEHFKVKITQLLSNTLDHALMTSNKDILSRYAKSDLVPTHMHQQFTQAINEKKGLRAAATVAVRYIQTKFMNLANKLNNYLEESAKNLANTKLDEHLEKYQQKDINSTVSKTIEDAKKSDINATLLESARIAIEKGVSIEEFMTRELKNNQNAQIARDAFVVASDEISKDIELKRLKEEVARYKILAQTQDLKAAHTYINQDQNFDMQDKVETLLSTNATVKEQIQAVEEVQKEEIENQKEPLAARVAEFNKILEEAKQNPKSAVENTERAVQLVNPKHKENILDNNNNLDVKKAEEHVQKMETAAQKPTLKYTDAEIQDFKRATKAELNVTDPRPILDDLGIEYQENGQDSYKIHVRNERTASAYINLKNGVWRYKDFGNGNSGTIENVVMDVTNMNYKDALKYSLDTLNIENKLETALNLKSNEKLDITAAKAKIAEQKQENVQKSRPQTLSKVVNVWDVQTNEKAQDYLKSRGITKIPDDLKVIQGEYKTKTGEIKKTYGVGVLTRDGTGADIHFLEKLGSMKIMSFGNKDISLFGNKDSSKATIFESKFDYAAAYQKDENIQDTNVIIANGVGNAAKIADYLTQFGIKDVQFYNQNDRAGYKFVDEIAQKANIPNFKAVQYDFVNEYKKDINDLLLDGADIQSRVYEISANSFTNLTKMATNFEQEQAELKKQNEQVQSTTQELNNANEQSKKGGRGR